MGKKRFEGDDFYYSSLFSKKLSLMIKRMIFLKNRAK